MKQSLTLFLLLAAGYARAQSADYTPLPHTQIRLNADHVPAYSKLSDTTSVAYYVAKGEEVEVVGTHNPGWMAVNRAGFPYFIAKRYFVNTPAIADELVFPRDANGLVTYTGVVPVENGPQAELYKRGKIWLASTFRSAKDVIQAEDKEAGFIVAKGYSPISIRVMLSAVPVKLYYTLKLSFKDGKYKYELTEFYEQGEPSTSNNYQPTKVPIENFMVPGTKSSTFAKINTQYKSELNRVASELIASLKANMDKSTDF